MTAEESGTLPSVAPGATRADPGRWVPRLMIAVALVHMLVGAVVSHAHWYGILTEGLWNTVTDDDDGRMKALWFMVSGLTLLGLGLQAGRHRAVTGRTPPETGWLLLALGVFISLLEPLSGGWALIALGVFAVLSRRADRSRRAD